MRAVIPRTPLYYGDNLYRPLLSPLGCDDGGRAHSDGRGVWWRGRASDHAAGEHAVRWGEWPGGWGQFQQLTCTGGTLALEQQGTLQSGEQEWQLPVVPVDEGGPNSFCFCIFFSLLPPKKNLLGSTWANMLARGVREGGFEHLCWVNFYLLCSFMIKGEWVVK